MIRRRLLLAAAAGLPAIHARAATSLTLAISSNTLAYGGLRIAEAAGLFPKHGIEPRITVMDSGNAAISAVVAGSAEFASSGPGEVLAAAVRGRPLVIVLSFFRGLSGSLVLSKAAASKLGVSPDAPVEQRLRALDGLSVAAPSPTSAYLHPYRAATEAVGAKVKFVYMTQPAMVAALQAGAVAGIIAGAPFSLNAIANGSGVHWISGPQDELPAKFRPASSACLQTTRGYATANPGVIAAMRAVSADLAELIARDPQTALGLLRKAYPSLDEATARSAFEESAASWSRSVMTADDIRQEIAIQASTGALPGVEAVDPASVLLQAGT